MADPTVPTAASSPSEGKTATVIYVLYLASILIGVTAVVGVVMAYVYRNDGPAWVRTHYQFQIRTFWIGLLFAVVGLLLTVILIGWLVLLALLIWLVIRCVKGMNYVSKAQAHPDPETWLF